MFRCNAMIATNGTTRCVSAAAMKWCAMRMPSFIAVACERERIRKVTIWLEY